MRREEFHEILLHYTNVSPEEAQKIIALKNAAPFSQVLHVLAARVSKDHGLEGHQKELQLAAIYSADRSVLKEIITRQEVTWPASMETQGQVHPENPSSISVPAEATEYALPKLDVADELMRDLKRLNELKHDFEVMFSESERTQDTPVETTITAIPETQPAEPVVDSKPESIAADVPPVSPPKKRIPPKRTKSGKTRAQRIVELAKGLNQQSEVTESTTETSKDKKIKTKKGVEAEIIEEIANSRKKIIPESEKQKEQLEIIDQFIKAQPSITGHKDKTATVPAGDLATIKSGEFGDNVISETLVDILLKQGKKDKAVEVLKKLIWKFPQKKAYFAAQIEELKK